MATSGTYYIHVSNCSNAGNLCHTDCASSTCNSNSWWGIWPNWGSNCINGHTAAAYCRPGHGAGSSPSNDVAGQATIVGEIAGCGWDLFVGNGCVTNGSLYGGIIKSCGPGETVLTPSGSTIFCSESGAHHLVASVNPALADQFGGWHGYGHRWARLSWGA